MIVVDGVSKRFPNGTLALDQISARFQEGEFIALLGPSGCGKSTLLRLLAGLEEPSSGQIMWPTKNVGDIGFVFQDATLMPWMSAAENVFLPLRLRGKSRAETKPAVLAALAQVGLAEFADAKPASLSGGMKMRVSIARALVSAPKLLLMDEPFAALDEFTRFKLQADLHEVWRRTGTTIVFVTHSIYEAAYLASRVLVMSPRPGRVAADIVSHVAEGPERRTAADYTAFVKQLSDTLRQVMPA
ncbi:MAG: ABC transporter ATP-binding protein [Acidocella sp. 20-57-95]|nr:MAG: ABC transporter ATP-binding protein [Acidocella sp. 20-57-95]OYV59486.1 MAG: ABC transporter ATP-binding protein [Acidocella sp. 21-58-7]HQT64893.1 ABC transporter ATP-binding protein [Acidocella sp.]HQU04237.1 ABC transporter ATP-binding protein [Acidocella sp.]